MKNVRDAATGTGKARMSRRRLLNGGTALGAYFLLPRSADAQHQGHDHSKMGLDPGPIVQAAAASMDQPLLEPEVRRSVNGVLQHDAVLSLCLQGHRRAAALSPELRGHEPRPDLAHEARRDAEDQAVERFPAEPRCAAAEHGAAAPVQQHELPLPRRALQPERHLRQCHALDGAGQEVRHRDHAAQGPHERHLLVSPAPSRRRRRADRQRHGGRHHRRGRFRRRARDHQCERARHDDVAGRLRRLRDDREFLDAVSGDRDALPGDQRPAPTDDHDAPRRGAALAAGRLAVPGRLFPRTREAQPECHRL